MRIISGKFKNKKIIQPLDNLTRPLKDITKESIFNILLHSKLINTKIENSRVLDLFSGSGSFGLECISRGAKEVVFCENYPPAIKILEINISNLGCIRNVEIIRENTHQIIKKKKLKEKFNIIFLDPPFKEEKIFDLLDNLKLSEILDKNGSVILHRNKKSEDNFPKDCKIVLEKIYGLSKIFFIKF
tara:strand:- start:20 stop:580 length:561 start_codon:yes stop_codon:yes gene_type:complete